MDPELIEAIDRGVVGADQPDLTFILDLPVETGLARAGARGGDARFESKDREFHERLRTGFREVADSHPGRCILIRADGGAPLDAIAESIWAALETSIGDPAVLAGAAND